MSVRTTRIFNIREAAAYFLKEPIRLVLDSRLGRLLPLPAFVPTKCGDLIGRCRDYRERLQTVERLFPGLRVRGGPFRGMRYAKPVGYCGVLFARLAGTYESELHMVFETAICAGYSRVLDIGSAEGYYAVGLALRLREAVVYAFDTSWLARHLCRLNARVNRVDRRVCCRDGVYDAAQVESLCLGERVLLISDCEGFEGEIFRRADPSVYRTTDLLIEVHRSAGDCFAEQLSTRLSRTHDSVLISPVADEAKLQLLDLELRASAECNTLATIVMENRLRTQTHGWLLLASRANGTLCDVARHLSRDAGKV